MGSIATTHLTVSNQHSSYSYKVILYVATQFWSINFVSVDCNGAKWFQYGLNELKCGVMHTKHMYRALC